MLWPTAPTKYGMLAYVIHKNVLNSNKRPVDWPDGTRELKSDRAEGVRFEPLRPVDA